MSKLKRIRIRMYRGILGDCFLLRTTVAEGDRDVVRSILIDCGVLQNVPSGDELFARLDDKVKKAVDRDRMSKVEAGPDRIRKITQDVLREVGERIDLLVVTHEHYDHLSGFAFAKDGFLDKGLTIGRLWMAWTENPKDEQAKVLQARFSKAKKALTAAAALAHSLAADAPQRLRYASDLAAFAGLQAPPKSAGGGVFRTADILQVLKLKAGPDATAYLEPGQVIDLDDFGIKAYVLGPPRDPALLAKDAPSHGDAKEVYLTRSDMALAAESTALTQLALHSEHGTSASLIAEITPFSLAHLWPIQKRASSTAKPRQPSIRKEIEDLYHAEPNQWRTIDTDWTGSIEALALKMDSDTNNTSLALAFELPDGQVLLFPGDAQVGNWLSWNRQTYPKKAPRGSPVKPITAENLLRRVTFYKAGHHASHNATAKVLGLERMTDPRLVAAIPVVEAVAEVQGKGRIEPGKGWKMPYGALHKALIARTQGRIVRGDGDPAAEAKVFAQNPTDTRRPVSVAHHDLWVELTFDL